MAHPRPLPSCSPPSGLPFSLLACTTTAAIVRPQPIRSPLLSILCCVIALLLLRLRLRHDLRGAAHPVAPAAVLLMHDAPLVSDLHPIDSASTASKAAPLASAAASHQSPLLHLITLHCIACLRTDYPRKPYGVLRIE